MIEQCRWGILGTATIARKNWAAIFHSGNGTLTAVASRETDRANAFIQSLQAECPFASTPVACTYEELLARQDIDAVYLPLPTGLRADWAIRAAQAGKHVLCEKPCAVDAAQLSRILTACREANVQFMDGVMFMHSQRLPALRNVLETEKAIGTIRRITGQFSFLAPEDFLTEDIRMNSQLEPQGCLGDLGWYLIRFALWTMDGQMPHHVSARMLAQHSRADSPITVPTDVSFELLFAGGVSAGFYCSFLTEHQQFAHISGTKGNVLLSDFVLPYYGTEAAFTVSNDRFLVTGSRFHMEQQARRVAVVEHSNNAPDAQEANLFRRFGEIVLSGNLDPSWPELSLKTQRILDACLESARHDACLMELHS